MKKYVFLLTVLSTLGLCINNHLSFAANWMRAGNTELILENEPKVGGVAIIRIKASVRTDIPNEVVPKARIYCDVPEGLEFINDKGYIVEHKQSVTGEWFDSVTLYEGPMKKDETRQILFKIKVPDAKKYTIRGGVTGGVDAELEIDLGEPDPPEWNPRGKERVGIEEGKRYILSGIKQLEGGKLTDLKIPEDALPPLRTELRIRTKYEPYVHMPYNPEGIPLRFLVYSEEEPKGVLISIELPEGLELINDRNYEVTTEEKEGKRFATGRLFKGPMRSKECRAFYFRLRSDKKEHFVIKVHTNVLTHDGKELFVEDQQIVELGRVLY
jgi:hypothetical protein